MRVRGACLPTAPGRGEHRKTGAELRLPIPDHPASPSNPRSSPQLQKPRRQLCTRAWRSGQGCLSPLYRASSSSPRVKERGPTWARACHVLPVLGQLEPFLHSEGSCLPGLVSMEHRLGTCGSAADSSQEGVHLGRAAHSAGAGSRQSAPLCWMSLKGPQTSPPFQPRGSVRSQASPP